MLFLLFMTLIIMWIVLDFSLLTSLIVVGLLWVVPNTHVSVGTSVSVQLGVQPSTNSTENVENKWVDVPVEMYDTILPIYIDNTQRNSDTVKLTQFNQQVRACKQNGECFENPIMKRHVDRILYACNNQEHACYKVSLK